MRIRVRCGVNKGIMQACGGELDIDTTQMGPFGVSNIHMILTQFYQEHHHHTETELHGELPEEDVSDDPHEVEFGLHHDHLDPTVIEDRPINEMLDEMDQEVKEVTSDGYTRGARS